MKKMGNNKLEIERIDKEEKKIVHTDNLKIVPEREMKSRNPKNSYNKERKAKGSYNAKLIIGMKTNYRSLFLRTIQEGAELEVPQLPPKTEPRKTYIPTKQYPLRLKDALH